MGGRFGKYGDIKRKSRLRRSRALKATGYRLKNNLRRSKKKRQILPKSKDKWKVSVEFKL